MFSRSPEARGKDEDLVPSEEVSFAGKCVDEGADEELLMEPEEDMCEPAWPESLQLMCTAEDGPPVSPRSHRPILSCHPRRWAKF